MMRLLAKLIVALPLPLVLLLGASPDRGKQAFEKRCTSCHALDHLKAGPRLRGVVGRAAAHDPEFQYSDALKQTRLVWTEGTLDKWLADPETIAPGNDMPFRLDNASERADIIAYLRQLGGK